MMDKNIKIEYTTHGNNISIQNTAMAETKTQPETPVIEINIGGYIGPMGGDDGQSIFMELKDFSDFITECTKLLLFMKSGGE